MARGVGGNDFCEYFCQREDDYSREAYNRETAIIRGNTAVFRARRTLKISIITSMTIENRAL